MIISFTMVNGKGDVVTASEKENKDLFDAARVGLGAVGILIEVTIQCEESFYLQRKVDSGLSTSKVLSNLDSYLNHAYHYFFWNPLRDELIPFTFDKVQKPAKLPNETVMYVLDGILGFLVRRVMFIASRVPLLNAIIMTAWYEIIIRTQKVIVDRGYRTLAAPKAFLQHGAKYSTCEYYVPRDRVQESLSAIKTLLGKKGISCNFPITLRFSKEDDIWLSPSYQRASAIISFGMAYKPDDFIQLNKDLDETLKAFEGRPHWANNHSLTANDLRKVYPKFEDFENVRKKNDPNGVFLNSYVKDCLLE